MSGTPDEEVDYGSCGSSANPSTDSDHKWSTSENDSQDLSDKRVLLISKTTRAEISSQYMRRNVNL